MVTLIELRVLGTVDLRERAANRPIQAVLAQPKRTALLCYLALATPRGPHRRDRLLLLFWPESPEDRARNSLNQAVFRLRQSLGDDTVVGMADEIGLAADAFWCDAAEFENALESGDEERALVLYGGELLPGFHLDGCSDFTRWLDTERERLRHRAVDAAVSRADGLARSGNGVAAVELLRRAMTWVPFDEPTVGRLLALLAGLGDRAGALREYERFRTLLATELDVTPSQEIEALVRKIQEGTSSVFRSEGAAERSPEPAGTPATARGTRRRLMTPVYWVAAAAVVAAAVLGTARLMAPPTEAGDHMPLDTRRVLVAAFENRTGEPTLDPLGYMAADWIAQGLAQTAVARVVPFSTVVQETPYLIDDAPISGRMGPDRRLARQVGAGVVVSGAYYRTDDLIAFQAQVIDVASGELLRGIDGVRARPDSLASAVNELQRRSVGTLAALFDERLESWPDPGSQPSSLEAYRLFSEGMGLFLSTGRDIRAADREQRLATAAAKFHEAATVDTTFTAALLWAGFAHLNRGDSTAAASVIRGLRDRRLSAWDRAVLDHLSAGLTGDWEDAYRSARVLADLSPDSEWLYKLGFAAHETRRSSEALDALLRVDPDRGWIREWTSYWRVRAEVQHVLGHDEAVLADVARGRAVSPGDEWLRTLELRALAALGRADDLLATLVGELTVGGGAALWRLNLAADELHAHGHAATAEWLLTRTVADAEAAVARDGGWGARAELAHLFARVGRDVKADALYRALMAEHPDAVGLRVRYAGIAARQGNPAPAGETAQWLAQLSGETLRGVAPDAFQLRYLWGDREAWLTLMRARVATNLGDDASVMELLHDAVERGLRHTYLHLHAEPDFERLRSHPGFQQLLQSR